jgi:hypothetical protein
MEDVTKMADAINKRLDAIEAMATDKSALDALKTSIENAVTKEDLTKLNADLDVLALEIKRVSTPTKTKNTLVNFEIQKNAKNNGVTQEDFAFSGVIKADVIHNLFEIGSGTFEDDEVNVDDATLTITAGAPRFSGRQSSSEIFINTISTLAEPLNIGEAMQEAIVYDESGDIDDAPEGTEKRVISEKVKIQKVEAITLPYVWYETKQFINRMGFIRPFLSENKNARYREKLANKIMSSINSLAATWVLPTGFNLIPDANYFDVLSALGTFIESNKYTPTHVVLNVVDANNMFTTKGLDGHYSLTNGGSIQVINGGTTLIINGTSVQLFKVDSAIQPQGTATMFDVSKLRFGLSPSLIATTNPYEYWRNNIVGFMFEGAYAVLLPENHPNAVVSGTFAEILEDITAPEEGGGE